MGDVKTKNRKVIRVVYPAGDGRIVLRRDEDWEKNLEAESRSQDGWTWDFSIETERPFFYFKPLLVRDGNEQWSRGENFLTIVTPGAPTRIHPYFLDNEHCSVCELMRPLASPAGAEHRFRVFLPPGYRENTLKHYPVLYMHDGNNLFLKEEAFLGSSGNRVGSEAFSRIEAGARGGG
jgi:hypothetical protein